MKPNSGIKFRQSLHWHWHSIPFQALILVLNSTKLVECLIETGSVHHNCGPLYRTVSELYITEHLLSKRRTLALTLALSVVHWEPFGLLPCSGSIIVGDVKTLLAFAKHVLSLSVFLF